jgi:hypothetical protein
VSAATRDAAPLLLLVARYDAAQARDTTFPLPLAAVEPINAPARAVASAEQRPTAARVDRLARHHLCLSGPVHSAASILTANPGRGLAGRVNGRIFPHRHCRPRELPELEKNRPPEPPFRAYK